MDSGVETGCIEVQTDNFTVEWIINNVKLLPQRNGEYIYSPYFINKEDHKVTWYLCLFPQGESKDEIGYISIHLCRVTRGAGPTIMKLHVELPTPESRVTQTLICTYNRYMESVHEKTMTSELMELGGPDGTIKIICKIEMSWNTINSVASQLSQDFRLLLNNPKFSDVAVIVGTQKFAAHKLVLAARSSVFSAMFEHKETQENLKREIKIEEMEPVIIKAMMEFFYADEVSNLEELACGLLGAAEKYDVQCLKRMCEKVLYKILDKDNAAEILIHADIYRSYQLKEHVMNFMANHLSDVIESVSYKEIEGKYPALLGELIRTIALRQKSNK